MQTVMLHQPSDMPADSTSAACIPEGALEAMDMPVLQ